MLDHNNKDCYDLIATPYRKANEYAIVDAIDIETVIRKKKDEIEAFESEVDTCLQISNSVTMMEIEV